MQALAAQGLNVFAMYDETAGKEDTGLGTGDFGWGSPTFHKMGRQKVRGSVVWGWWQCGMCVGVCGWMAAVVADGS